MHRFFKGNGFALMLFILLAARMLLRDSFLDDPLEWVISTLLLLPGIVIGITLHEFAHAFAAYKLGDPTPKLQRRVTLNPLAHMEPLGIAALLLVGFGWGKPVEVNPMAFRRQRLCTLIVDVAGVATNLLVAIIFMGILRMAADSIMAINGQAGYYLLAMLQNVIWMNLVLMIFNLLPVPPLDGFGIITEIFNLRGSAIYYKIYNAGFPILMLLFLFNIPSRIISPVINAIYGFLVGVFF
jgi:Zn-dependent protease